MKVLTVVGARPQFIKALPVSHALRRRHEEVLVHTGQHYDYEMSAIFFEKLDLPEPDANLEVGSGGHAEQTALTMKRLEPLLGSKAPDVVLVYGDTNSTLAAALTAAKLSIPVAHVEAGLRSFNRSMPEEINRILADRLADLLFCPSAASVSNLRREGIVEGVYLVGDVMLDSVEMARGEAAKDPGVLAGLGLSSGEYLLATIHRAENTTEPARLGAILSGLEATGETVVLPVHPRTREALQRSGHVPAPRIRLVPPVGYVEMLALTRSARVVVTDSGGLQKEAFWLGVPCVTARRETEWEETVESGWNRLAGADADSIVAAVRDAKPPLEHPSLYGEPGSALRIVELLERAVGCADRRARVEA